MFSGIIETLGTVTGIRRDATNLEFTIAARFDEALKVDQSIAHNGVCLTVTRMIAGDPSQPQVYRVTAIEETLHKTTLGHWQEGDHINLERCVRTGQRMDGHFVQGHVDTTGTVIAVKDHQGSWELRIAFDPAHSSLIVPKGSIAINGVSLTVVDALKGELSVALIPYTWEHTQFHSLKAGDRVNLEFDILGKYILRAMELRNA